MNTDKSTPRRISFFITILTGIILILPKIELYVYVEDRKGNILAQLVQAIEIQRGVHATSTALKLENEIGISFSQYDPKKVGFTLRVDLRDVMDRERAEKRSNPFWY